MPPALTNSRSFEKTKFYFTDLPNPEDLGKALQDSQPTFCQSSKPSAMPSLKLLEQGGKEAGPVSLHKIRNPHYKGLLSSKELKQIERYYPAYRQAEQVTGVDWRIIAAVHHREASLGLNRQAKKNPFQFDGVYRKNIQPSFAANAIEAGKILQEKLTYTSLPPLHPGEFEGEKVKEALFGYNGKVYKSAERSPYVMNQWDEAHQNMKIYRGKNASPRWGTDRRLGAMALIREINAAYSQ